MRVLQCEKPDRSQNHQALGTARSLESRRREKRKSVPSSPDLSNLQTITLLPSYPPGRRLKHTVQVQLLCECVLFFDLVHRPTSPPAHAGPPPSYPRSRGCERHKQNISKHNNRTLCENGTAQ